MVTTVFKIFFVIAITASAFGETKPPSKDISKGSPQKADSPHEEFNKNTNTPMNLPAAIGEDMQGIMIPQYDAEGNLMMSFFAKSARKINETEVNIDSLTINFFQKNGKDMTLFLLHGLFNLETKILSSKSPVTLKREDFEMTGESITFDTIKRSGSMDGHVHTDVRNGISSQEHP